MEGWGPGETIRAVGRVLEDAGKERPGFQGPPLWQQGNVGGELRGSRACWQQLILLCHCKEDSLIAPSKTFGHGERERGKETACVKSCPIS